MPTMVNCGASKGPDYLKDDCVVLNPASWKHFHPAGLANASPTTRSKVHVAPS